MYEGRTDVKAGTVPGHENQGEVIEVGKAADVYRHFDAREKGWTKVALKPAA